MELKTKKLLTNITTGVFFLLGGIEFAVIIPTLYLYIKDLHGNESFYGLSYSAFSVSGIFAGPLFGRITDHVRKTKLCVMVANMFQIGGNFMYFVGSSKYMVLGGRLMAGVGMGAAASILAQLAWTSTEKERTAVFSVALALRQVGMMIGPALNVFLEKIKFNLGPFEVNDNSVPGLFMAALWCITQVMIIFMYYDLPSNHNTSSSDEKRDIVSGSKADHVTPVTAKESDVESGKIKNETDRESSTSDTQNIQQSTENKPSINWINEYLREEIILLLAIPFVLNFNLLALETIVVPLTIELFGWDVIANSGFFCGTAAISVTVYFIIRFISKKVSDRWIIAFGLAIQTAAFCYLMVFVPSMTPKQDVTKNVIIFLVGCFLAILGIPCYVVGPTSLLSKLTSKRHQGTMQGSIRVLSNVGDIMGPLWAGAMLKKLRVLMGVVLGLQGIVIVMTALTFNKLKVGDKESEHTSSQTGDKEEKKPLLEETA